MPFVVLLRKLEFLFYFLFVILALTCIVIPQVYGMDITAFYIAAGLAAAYVVCIYFLRFQLYAHFALMLHSGIFLAFSSTIFFESGYTKVGIAMAVIGILSVVIVFVLASLGRRVVVRGRGGRRPEQARLNWHIQMLRDNMMRNPGFAAGVLLNLNGDLAVEHDVLRNDPDNHRNPALPDGPENNPNEDLENEPDDQGMPNGHAIQMREGPDVQPAEGRNGDVVRQRQNVNEQVVQQRDNPDDVQQREDANEQVVQE